MMGPARVLWWCSYREINSQTGYVSTYCGEDRMYDIEITVDDSRCSGTPMTCGDRASGLDLRAACTCMWEQMDDWRRR